MRNEATLGRALRVLIGIALIALVFVGPKTAWGWLGGILVGTGVFGFCPVYRVLGINTCRMRRT